MSKLSGKYPGESFLDLEIKGSDPLIEEVLFERDNSILLGREKAGKSIMALQMMCHLTSGEPFLGRYRIPKQINVAYVQGEGKLANTQANLKNMTRSIHMDKTRFCLFYYPSLALDTDEGLMELRLQIESWKKPDLIILDPLYMLMQGDLLSSTDAKRFVANLRELSEHFQSTNLLVHHGHRPKRNQDGSILNEGDDSIFGSFVWKAYPDHILNLERVTGNKFQRRLSCDTQRMGNLIDSIDIVFIEPTPLYFELKGDLRPSDTVVHAHLDALHPKTIMEISLQANVHQQTVWSCIKRLEVTDPPKVVCSNPHENPRKYKKYSA